MMRNLARLSRFGHTGAALGLLLLAGGSVSARGQPVQGRLRCVGFPAAVSSRFVIRNGQWFPILAELTAPGGQPREVELRCEQVDLDGDRLAYLEPYVAVNPGSVRRVWCYAISLKENAGHPVKLDVIDRRDGALITSLRVPPFESISNDTQLFLDVSARRVTWLDGLDAGQLTYNGLNLGARRFYRSICVANLPAGDLPDRWYGLEAVDVVVWDEPDPDALPRPAQLRALIEWVRNGGQLVVGIGSGWAKIQKSALAEIMPLTGTQQAVETSRLPTLFRRYARAEVTSFKAPVSLAVADPAAGALVTFKDRLPDGRPVNLIAIRTVGSGRVIAAAARLRDLTGAGLKAGFYHELFDLNRNSSEFNTNEAKQAFLAPLELYAPLTAQTQFRRLASIRVLIAFAFVAGYILIATFGTWAWLGRHRLTHLSWTAFAGLAVIASLLSLGAVGLSRGVTGTVHSFSFVDLEAGASEARATTQFGYKSIRRQRVDLSLPGEGSYLRPLATGPEPSTSYATPLRYTALANKATLADTPMRATLKQFEGFWRGSLKDSLGGDLTIRGGLTADRRTGKITSRSWLQNELGVDLLGGYLLYIDPRLRERDGGVPYRVAGLNTRNDRPERGNRYYGSEMVPPAVNVLVVEVPALKAGERIADLGRKEYEQYDPKRARWEIRPDPDPKHEPMLPTLWHQQVGPWAASVGGRTFGGPLAPVDAAALLASTRNLYLHNPDKADFNAVGRPVSTAGLSHQDVTHWLTRGQALLLLLADQPGPTRLHLNGKPKQSKQGRTLYRVRIPIRYSGSPPRGAAP